ncbi:TetR/AcrR family transcriptional regulator [Salipaludibacillus neizhouensis]|uniref:TetR/AcrR family transcriptional regulator n=1 Tax=Salipaludibacillus neizhouensis TaxID=885475 RepID=UPI001CBA693F|nr:TetR-like C-terminal domain-containing protein [Salipaludibacillus neizhouensis]
MNRQNSITDPRKIRTRKLLRDAFIELLQEMDIEKITVNRLAERATINRVTFYLHYSDIPDMQEKMADDMIDDIKHVFDNPLKNGKKLEKLLVHISEDADFYKITLASKVVPIFRERLNTLLSDKIVLMLEGKMGESSIVKAGIPKDIIVWYNSSALIGVIISWLQNDIPYTPSFLAKHFIFLHNSFLK